MEVLVLWAESRRNLFCVYPVFKEPPRLWGTRPEYRGENTLSSPGPAVCHARRVSEGQRVAEATTTPPGTTSLATHYARPGWASMSRLRGRLRGGRSRGLNPHVACRPHREHEALAGGKAELRPRLEHDPIAPNRPLSQQPHRFPVGSREPGADEERVRPMGAGVDIHHAQHARGLALLVDAAPLGLRPFRRHVCVEVGDDRSGEGHL